MDEVGGKVVVERGGAPNGTRRQPRHAGEM